LKSISNHWRLNENIPAQELRVLDFEGKQIGVLSKTKAIELAKEQGVDLIEIAPNANPPVAKIMDFGKFRYQEEKKAKEAQKKSKPSEMKELRFTPFIGEGDYQTRIKRIDEFLLEKSKIKLVVYFQTKQLGSKSFGYDILSRILRDLGEGINVDMKPKFLGRNLIMIISPTNIYGKDKNKK
jgi:translation initiation factor IF-3